MSVFPKETVLAIAESIGIVLQDEVANVLLQDTEYRMREIIHEAIKFMRHSRRQKLTSADINSALAVRNVEPLYGFINGAPSNFKMTSMGSQALYYLEDQEYDLEDLISRPLPPVPVEATYTAHWLAVDGAQPRIVQNPTPSDAQAKTDSIKTTTAAATSTTTTTLRNGEKHTTDATSTHTLFVKDVLTKELQMYYEKITEMLTSDDLEIRSLAIESIAKDPGVQGIMPYFVQFVSDTVTRSLKNLELLWTMMRFTRAILSNMDLDPEPYLHQMIPSILTCIVAKRLSASVGENHWALRLFAAKLASHVCVHFGASYPTLQPRVTKTLLRAMLDPVKPLATVYGALAALAALGKEVVCALVLPNVAALGMRLEHQLRIKVQEGVPESPAVIEARKCAEMIKDIVMERLKCELKDALMMANADVTLADEPINRAEAIASLKVQWEPRPLGMFANDIWNALENSPH
ncbi:hypothetical protein BASA82_000385 [Batrachochytrium salamandrivorans]|uniref:TATA box binding protein associated factor (TAF) histone-like fold domain-containing protein n=1 Tax=Batrachochytrium salamandrivorans TaxID=1357716 RepID=A0ABQ8FF34_9FUNG|nr:hypothetical protein BASA50_004578 [Batrachochytrium salamandrivorans]KAH9262556.1 hypothetical protein BASA82_000385 [Batrachochytrium salamandrivorans]KAH9267596.1 hypothetical protein BASA84_000602 [Batrachochytrium salamandrivorans]KAJ1344298.1 hypothetical protein BSLG_001438 [Batrachochytrium salamandrivorans]